MTDGGVVVVMVPLVLPLLLFNVLMIEDQQLSLNFFCFTFLNVNLVRMLEPLVEVKLFSIHTLMTFLATSFDSLVSSTTVCKSTSFPLIHSLLESWTLQHEFSILLKVAKNLIKVLLRPQKN